MPTGDFPPPEGMIWSDAAGWIPALPTTPVALNNPYADTFCPCCGAAEPAWNGANADPKWLDQSDEIERLRQLLTELTEAAAHDLKCNQDYDGEHAPGGWWSLRTENAIRAARAYEQ